MKPHILKRIIAGTPRDLDAPLKFEDLKRFEAMKKNKKFNLQFYKLAMN